MPAIRERGACGFPRNENVKSGKMAFISDKDRKYIEEMFKKSLNGDVNISLFVDAPDKCAYCKDTKIILEELASIDGRLKLKAFDMQKEKKEAGFLGVDKTPAIVLWNKNGHGVYYFGIPAQYEFSSLLEDIVDISRGASRLSDATKAKLKEIDKPIDIKVFVTPTCPYCPKAVRMAHQFAMENKNIRASMIDSMEFEEMSNTYEVMGVPKVVINDKASFEGALPEEAFLQQVMGAIGN